MPIIYSIYPHAEGEKYVFRSKEEAAAAARKLIADDADINEVDVIRHETPPFGITMLIDIINAQGGAYSVGENVVHTIRRRGKPKPMRPRDPDQSRPSGDPRIDMMMTASGQTVWTVGGVGFRSLEAATRFLASGGSSE